jgi:hypothetical protein
MSFYRLFVFHSQKGASRWKTNNRQRGEQLPTLERQHTGTMWLQGHDRLQSNLARHC